MGVELVIAYCTAVLRARSMGIIKSGEYKAEYDPLIRILLAENYPILSTIARPGGYVAAPLVDHIADLEASGWRWKEAFDDLAGAPQV